jgi:hypothetical protein
MSKNLDILGLLRKYECYDNLKKQAADEIERLRSLIVKFVDAEREYQFDYQDAYNSPDDSASVLIKDEWRNSWTALRAESDSIKEVRGE